MTPAGSLLIIFSTAFVVGLSGALMPGPVLALTIAEVAQRGFWAGPAIILGHAVLELALVVGLVKGLSRFLQRHRVVGVIGLLGGACMIWMGSTMCASPGYFSLSSQSPTQELGATGMLILSGALVSMANPYWSIWWATIGLSYITRSTSHGVPGMTSFYIGHELADFTWYTLISFGVATGAKVMSQAVYRGLVLVCGVALLGLGIYFVVTGVRNLRKPRHTLR